MSIVVLSGNEYHTKPRLQKGFELFYTHCEKKLILNGFNTKEKHDFDFDGSWKNDPRLTDYIDKIEEIHPIIVHARNTCENAYELAKLTKRKENSLRLYKIVTSDFHVKRCKYIFRKFLHPHITEFVGVPTARDMKELHRLKLHKIIQEFFCNYYFHGLKRGDDIEKIKNIYNKREAKVKGLLSKFFKRF